jgi:quinol monooxygenase YgiN
MEFVILVQGTAVANRVEVVKEAAAALARDGSNDPGTIYYAVYQAEDDPASFTVFARFRSKADWQRQIESAYHEKFWQSLPEDTWAVHPERTDLIGL